VKSRLYKTLYFAGAGAMCAYMGMQSVLKDSIPLTLFSIFFFAYACYFFFNRSGFFAGLWRFMVFFFLICSITYIADTAINSGPLSREIYDIKKFMRLPENKKSIVFYSEHEGYFPNFEGIIKELTEKHKRHVCYVTSSAKDPILLTKNNFITPIYSKTLLPWFMRFLSTQVCVMTMPDIDKFHIRRSINPVHYVYIFHALVSTHMMYQEGAFDHYDTIICTDNRQIKEIRAREKQEKLVKKHLVPGGYYRLEKIYKSYLEHKKNKRAPSIKTVLIAPSWGEHNIIKTCGKKIIKNILQNTNYNVILRPHPEITKRTPGVLLEYKKLFGKNSRFRLETSVATNKSMLNADLLITDLSGIAFEYAFGTERPVLFVDLPYKIKNKNYKKLGIEPFEVSIRSELGAIVSPNNLSGLNPPTDTISDKIKTILSKQDLFKEKIQKLRAKYVYKFGESSQIAAKTILDCVITDFSYNNLSDT
jgi:YidC/Oxa1 family membrane protein insertase